MHGKKKWLGLATGLQGKTDLDNFQRMEKKIDPLVLNSKGVEVREEEEVILLTVFEFL